MYVIYDKETTRIVEVVRHRPYRRTDCYKTMSAARAALTRMNKKFYEQHPKNSNGYYYVSQQEGFPEFAYGIAEAEYYHKHIEKQVKRVNMMTGKEYYESINTPNYMSPSSEAYWSM